MRIYRVGPRTWALALLVGLSVVDPGFVITWGPYIVLGVWLLGNPARFRVDLVFWTTCATIAWQWTTTLWATNPAARSVTLTATLLGLMFILARDALRTREQLRFVAWGFVAGAVFAAGQLSIGSQLIDPITGRYTIEGLNANYLGYAFCGALAIVVLLWQGATKRGRTVLLASIAAIVVGLLLTGTRGAALGAVCLLLWLFACWAVKSPPFKTLLAIALAVAVVITTGILDAWIVSLEFGARATGDWSNRFRLWPLAREIWSMDWLLGQGPQAVRSTTGIGDAHSVFLEIGSAQGAIGVALFLALLVAALGDGTRGYESRPRRLLLGAFLAATTPALLSGAWETAPAFMMLLMIFSRIAAPSVPSESVRAAAPAMAGAAA